MIKYSLFLLIFLSLMSPVSFAGNEMGNGTDNFSGDFGAAWFIGETKTIFYCLEIDSRFGRSATQIRSDIQASWKKWLDYTSAKKLYSSDETEKTKFPLVIAERSCNGSEDLHFYFGIETPEVSQVKAQYQHPSAISQRVSYDSKLGWGKGWIWFSLSGVVDVNSKFPDWSSDTVFQSILLHEVGHVFGNVHVAGTIMDRELSQKLRDRNLKTEWIGKIDNTKELLSRGGVPDKTSGYLGGSGYFNPFRAFEWLTGRKPIGKISAFYEKTDSTGATAQLRVKDDKGESHFTIGLKPSFYSPSYSSDLPVFKRVREDESMTSYSQGQVNFSVLHHPKLGEVTALLESSMSSSVDSIGPVGIKVLLNGFPQPIFEGFPEN